MVPRTRSARSESDPESEIKPEQETNPEPVPTEEEKAEKAAFFDEIFAEMQARGIRMPRSTTMVSGPAQTSVTPPINPLSVARFPNPDTYAGDPDGLDGFLDQMHDFLDANGYDLSSARSVSVASMFFRGAAKEWFAGVRRAVRMQQMPALLSWYDLERVLTEWIRPVDTRMLHYEAFFHITQGKNQTVKDYIAAYNSARMRVATPPICDPVLCYVFLRGLKPHIRPQVVGREPQTLSDYMRVANSVTDLVASIPGKPVPSLGSTHAGSSKPSTSNGSRPICAFCKKVGHTEEQCWKKDPKLRPEPKKKEVRFNPKVKLLTN
jgi:hypothetical protein